MIDTTRLAELREDFGSDGLAELIEIFTKEAAQAIDALAPFCEQGPSQERREQFHFLKGCAVNVGASDLGATCARFETSDDGFSCNDFARLNDQFNAVRSALATADV